MTTGKVPLVLVPGMLCDATSWQAQESALADIADVHVVELRGHSTFESLARTILEDAVDRFALAGHSMGARIALEVYRQAPDRVLKLALLDTGVHPLQPDEPERRQAAVKRAEEIGLAAYADEWIDQILPGARDAQSPLYFTMKDMIAGFTPADFRMMTDCMLSRADAAPILAEVTCPTLMICGEKDSYSPPVRHVQMANSLSDCDLHIIDDCGHMAPMEQPDMVSGLMRRWLMEA